MPSPEPPSPGPPSPGPPSPGPPSPGPPSPGPPSRDGAGSGSVACSLCGTTADSQPLTWSSSTGPAGLTLLCEQCTRQHLRALEAKLDQNFW